MRSCDEAGHHIERAEVLPLVISASRVASIAMAESPRNEITRLLLQWRDGDQAALAALLPLVYQELRQMAQRHLRRERSAHTLQRTALVHEAFLRLVDQTHVDWQSRRQFFALASEMMRRILVDHARRRGAVKRGGERARVDVAELVGRTGSDDPEHGGGTSQLPIEDARVDFGEFDQALQQLEQIDARKGKLVELRFFGGLTLEEAAQVIGVSLATAKRDWAFARAWLERELA